MENLTRKSEKINEKLKIISGNSNFDKSMNNSGQGE
jgi:hypothetical protein